MLIAIIFILLFLSSLVIYIYSTREVMKWVSSILFIASLYILVHSLLANKILPYQKLALIDVSYTYLYPYCYLMLGLALLDWSDRKTMKYWSYFLLLIPSFIFFLLDPFGKIFYEYMYHQKINFTLFLAQFIWASIYTLTANGLILYRVIKEKSLALKKENIKLAVIFIPVTFIVLIVGYYGPLQYSSTICDLQVYLIILTLVITMFYLFIPGFYGIKLKIEKYYDESTKRTLNLGASMINHTIKNEIQKLALCAEVIKVNKDQENLNAIADIIINSTSHMSTMINRIQSQLKDISINEEVLELNRLIEESLEMLRTLIDQKRIEIIRQFDRNMLIRGDKLHLKEVFINLFKNAIEAMDEGGELSIASQKTKKDITISIHDNGHGIPNQDLDHVFDWFYSTKGKDNYGLGLSYCNTIIKKHHGYISIESKENAGTTVFINLPLPKMLKAG